MSKFVLSGGRLIDATGRPPIERSVVVVEGSRVVFAGASSDVGQVDGAQDLDVSGMTVLPGLINSHCHLVHRGDGEPTEVKIPRLARTHDTLLTLYAAEQARKNLDYGVTTVRDTHPSAGGTEYQILSLRDAIKAGVVPGCRIVSSGRIITMVGGHGSQWVSWQCSGVEECRRAARETLKNGADFVKVMAAAGNGPMPGKPETWARMLTVEEMAAIVDVAHRAGKPVSAHTHGVQGISDVLDAGVDSVEHGSGLTDELIERMVKQGAYFVPTISSYEMNVRGDLQAGAPTEKTRDLQGLIERHRPGIAKAIQAGVKIAAGTDAGAGWCAHGESVIVELESYVSLGMTPMQAIMSATQTAANLLQLGDRIGIIEPGKVADLIVVDGNPLDDVGNLRRVRLVMKEGKVHRQELKVAAPV